MRLTWSICPQWGAPPLLSLSQPQTWPGLLGRCHCCWTSSSRSERSASWLCVSPFYTARLRFELNWQTRDFCDLTTLAKYCRSNRKERSKPPTEIGNVLIFPSYTAILTSSLLTFSSQFPYWQTSSSCSPVRSEVSQYVNVNINISMSFADLPNWVSYVVFLKLILY